MSTSEKGPQPKKKSKRRFFFFKLYDISCEFNDGTDCSKVLSCLSTAAKTSYKTTWSACTYNSQVDQKAKMKLQRKINPSEHLSDSCISRNLTDNPSKCCSQLTSIGGTLPVVTNSHLPHPQRERVCVCVRVCVSNLMFNATSPPFALITVSVMNF